MNTLVYEGTYNGHQRIKYYSSYYSLRVMILKRQICEAEMDKVVAPWFVSIICAYHFSPLWKARSMSPILLTNPLVPVFYTNQDGCLVRAFMRRRDCPGVMQCYIILQWVFYTLQNLWLHQVNTKYIGKGRSRGRREFGGRLDLNKYM